MKHYCKQDKMDVLTLTVISLLSASAVGSFQCRSREDNCKPDYLKKDESKMRLTCNVTDPNQFFSMGRNESNHSMSYLTVNLLGIELLPSNAFVYKNLVGLIISSDGSLNQVHPDAFYGVRTSLETLELSGTTLEEVPMKAIERLDKLNSLGLSRNSIISLNSLRSMDLHRLILRENRISEIGQYFLPKTLKVLDLRKNRVRSLYLVLKEHLPAMETLLISWNTINELDHGLTNVPNLINLNAGRNSIESLENLMLHFLPKLYMLNLSFNRIQSISYGLKGLSNLYQLFLNNNGIRYLNVTAFSDLSALKVLDLSYNNLRFIQEDTFDCLKSLMNLDVKYNRLALLNFLRNPSRAILLGQGKHNCTFRDYANLKWLHMKNSGANCNDASKEVLQYVSSKKVAIYGNPCSETAEF